MTKQIRRKHDGTITDSMFRALQCLAIAERNEMPFITLDGVNIGTIRALQSRDWMVISKGLDGTRYRITGRGLKAFNEYNTPSGRRFDNICPSCGINSREGYFPSGKKRPYCLECQRKNHKKGKVSPASLCSACKSAPRHQYRSGQASAYCTDCQRAKSLEQKRRRLERVLRGETILCSCCHEAPVYCNRTTASSYCHECLREYQNKNARKRALSRAMR
jgi:hypothetical protein